MRKFDFLKKGMLACGLLLASILPVTTWAHGGPGGAGDFDTCRVMLGPNKVHFTAYQPQIAGTTEYCDAIPELGNAILVFDYEGQGLRKINVEFEVTKEPEGKSVFKKAPEMYPTGTANFTINFTEPGDYLGHVTISDASGNKIDGHVPFKVGVAQSGLATSTYIVIGVILIAAGYIFYLSNASFKNAVDRMMNKQA